MGGPIAQVEDEKTGTKQPIEKAGIPQKSGLIGERTDEKVGIRGGSAKRDILPRYDLDPGARLELSGQAKGLGGRAIGEVKKRATLPGSLASEGRTRPTEAQEEDAQFPKGNRKGLLQGEHPSLPIGIVPLEHPFLVPHRVDRTELYRGGGLPVAEPKHLLLEGGGAVPSGKADPFEPIDDRAESGGVHLYTPVSSRPADGGECRLVDRRREGMGDRGAENRVGFRPWERLRQVEKMPNCACDGGHMGEFMRI